MITSQDGTSSLKPEAEWTNAEDNDVHVNSKALNVIFNGVDKNMFRLINTCLKPKKLERSQNCTSRHIQGSYVKTAAPYNNV
jgi:hypothetical protein